MQSLYAGLSLSFLVGLGAGCAGPVRSGPGGPEEPDDPDQAWQDAGPPPRSRVVDPAVTPPGSAPSGTPGAATDPATPAPDKPTNGLSPAAPAGEPADAGASGAAGPDAGLALARDAGPRPAASGPPPVMTGGPAPACRGHFCDSFEAGNAGEAPAGWSRNGNIVIDATRAARGAKSLRIRNGGINPGLFMTKAGAFPPGKSTIYGRVFIWFDKRPQAGSLVHWTLAEVRGGGGPAVRVLGGISQTAFKGRNNLLFNIDPGGGERGKEDHFPTPALGEKVWHCLEWMLTRGAKDEARTWWNEEERPRLTYNGDWGPRFKFPSFDSLALGFATYQSQGAFEVWVDELAISEQRLGCGP